MNKRIIIILLILFCCYYTYSLSARRSRGSEPEWLTNPQSRYPETQFIVAIGEGDSRNRAEANAASNLARIFETRVETEELFSERYEEIISGDTFDAVTTSDIDRSITLSSDQTLYNIQFAESYTNNMGRVYVLAYLDRLRTADIYLDMINRHAEQVNYLRNRYAEVTNNLHQYAYISAASVMSTANEVLIDQLNIIAGHLLDMLNLGYDHNDIILQARNTARQLTFSIDISNDRENQINSVIADMLTEQGFIVSNSGSIPITAEILIEDVDLQRPEKFVRWHLTLNVYDPQGANILTHSQRGREGHVTHSEAVARAFRAMEREVHREFYSKLFNYFDNLVK